jgi:adenylate cyclase
MLRFLKVDTMAGMQEWFAALNRDVRTVLVLDVVESVRLAELDEIAFVQRWIALSTELREKVIPQFSGRLIKTLGDGLMVDFSQPGEAVQCAFAILDAAAQGHGGIASQHSGDVTLRIGVHTGEVFSDDHDLYGRSVNLAARLAGLAGPNQVVVSAGIRDGVCDHLDADIEDMGDCYVKHIAEPIHAFRLRPPGSQTLPLALPGDHIQMTPVIAVVPFMPRSGSTGDHWLGEILADDVIAAISRSSELTVISRLSTSPLKRLFNSQNPEELDLLTTVRERLNSQYALTGSFIQRGSLLDLHVELVDAKRLNVLWASNLRCDASDFLHANSVQLAELVNAVSRSIVKNEMAWARKTALPNVPSYALLMAAISFMHRASTSDFKRVAEILRALIDRHPRQALPRAWLAKWHALSVTRGLAQATPRSAQEALSETGRALDIDPECSLALAIEGMVYCQMKKDLVTADDRYQKALTANPNDSMAWLYKGVLHSFKSEKVQAKAAGEKALSLTPLDPMLYFYQSLAASAMLCSEDYPRVIELATASIRSNRSHTSSYRALAIAQVFSGQTQAASLTIKELLKLEPGFTVTEFLRRTPTADLDLGRRSAQALREAGVPN